MDEASERAEMNGSLGKGGPGACALSPAEGASPGVPSPLLATPLGGRRPAGAGWVGLEGIGTAAGVASTWSAIPPQLTQLMTTPSARPVRLEVLMRRMLQVCALSACLATRFMAPRGRAMARRGGPALFLSQIFHPHCRAGPAVCGVG